MTERKPTQACYWIIGAARAPDIAPAVAIDLHYDNFELAAETHTVEMGPHDRGVRAREIAEAYARQHGIPASAVFNDPDSTDAFRNC